MRFRAPHVVSAVSAFRQQSEALFNEFQYFLKPQQGKPSPPRRLDRRKTDKPLTAASVRQWYERPLSFTRYLPWVDYLDEDRCVLLEDGQSVGAFFDLIPTGCEARPQAYLEALHAAVTKCLLHAIPEEDPPWVVQCFVQVEPVAGELMRALRTYVAPGTEQAPYTQHFLDELARHLARLERPEGYFFDDHTGYPWRVKALRSRLVLYRRLPQGWRSPQGLSPEQDLNVVAERFTESLASSGVACRRGSLEDLQHWMLRWFNPRPAIPDADPQTLVTLLPVTPRKSFSFSPDLAERFILGWPASDAASGTWWFDGLPHSVLTVQHLLDAPKIGHLTAERERTGRSVALFDLLPDGVTLAMTVVVEPQDRIKAHLDRLARYSIGDSSDAAQTRREVAAAREQLAEGNKLYRLNLAFYLRGEDLEDLRRRETRIAALLMPDGLQPVAREHDPVRLTAYVKNLPMNFEPALDKHTHWAKLSYADSVAALFPVYGRSRGTGHPGILKYNRGGEPLLFDPLNPRDRKKNAHCFFVGPTGSGKSTELITDLLQLIAIHRPRIFVFDPVGSMDLFGQHLAREGLTVHQVTIAHSSRVSLPPFHDALRLLQSQARPQQSDPAPDQEHWALDGHPEATDTHRDPLGEMELAARLMITGGQAKEEERMSRADHRLIQKAILQAARVVEASSRAAVLTEDVAQALRHLEGLTPQRHERAAEMADCLEMYCEGFTGSVFNRPGEPWPEADVTILNAGVFATKGFEDKLALAVIGFVNHINSLAEREKYRDRHSIFVIDECHLVFCHPVLPPYMVMASKVWGRRLAVWLWLATQNMKDMPDHAERILNMLEWWVCMSMPSNEIAQLARFRDLNPEERALLSAARKEPGKYVEGVILADALTALFRSVPPRLHLALSQTEKEERAARAKLMGELGCSELEAAYAIARRMESQLGY